MKSPAAATERQRANPAPARRPYTDFRRPCSDFRHVTAVYELSYYYYLLLLLFKLEMVVNCDAAYY